MAQVFYHGTSKDFEKPKLNGLGVLWLAPNPRVAASPHTTGVLSTGSTAAAAATAVRSATPATGHDQYVHEPTRCHSEVTASRHCEDVRGVVRTVLRVVRRRPARGQDVSLLDRDPCRRCV